MITLYPSRTIERYFSSAWDDISAYVVGDISFDIGMASDRYDDRLGKVGKFSLVINNNGDTFEPDLDFPKRMKIRITVDAGHSVTKTIICYVDYIIPPKNFAGEESKFIKVSGTCWFGLAYTNLLRSVVVQEDKTIDEAATVLLTEIPIQPTGTDFDAGTQTFPYVFDIVKTNKTTLYSELNHLVISELGYCYMTSDDVLTIENYTARSGVIPLPTYSYSYPTDDGSAALMEDNWQHSGAWSISSGSAICTPTLGSELLTNAGLETFTGGLADGWTADAGVTPTQETTIKVQGTSSQKAVSATSPKSVYQNLSLDVDMWYHARAQVYTSSNIITFLLGKEKYTEVVDAWNSFFQTARGDNAVNVTAYNIDFTFYLDDTSTKLIPTADTLCTYECSVVDVKIGANVTVNASAFGGVCGWLDDKDNPQNYIIAYCDGSGNNVYLEKCVGGTYSTLVSDTVAYSAGAQIQLRGHISGGNLLVSVYYNGVIVGTEQTVSDAGIISNTLHGMFSTYSGNTFSRADILNYADDSVIVSDLFERVNLNPIGLTNYILTEDGFKILLDQATTSTFDSTFTKVIDADVVHGKNVINEVAFTVNPRKVDQTVGAYETVYTYNLYTPNPAIPITDGATIKLRGGYWDEYPSHKSKIDAAMDVVEPTVGGSVSQFIVSPVGTVGMTFVWKGGADSWEWEITNNSGVDKTITYMEFGGRPISNQQPLEYSVEDTGSQDVYGKNSVSINQAYKDELDIAVIEASALLEKEIYPRTQIKSIDLCANIDEHEMLGFMYTDVGDYRRVTLTNPGKDFYTWIQGIKGTISPAGLINYTLTLQEESNADAGMYNDDDARMSYTGSWSDWDGGGSGAYNDDLHYLANGQGGYVTFTFSGNRFKFYYTKMNDRGSVKIYIDDVLVYTLDQYNVTQIFQSTWDSGLIGSSSHTVKIEKVGTSDVVDIDAIEVVS